MTELEEYQKAKDRVDEIKGFYAHAAMYGLTNVALIILNLATLRANNGVVWFIWPLLGWGIALAVHAISVYGIGPFLGKGWEEREIQRELERRRTQTPA